MQAHLQDKLLGQQIALAVHKRLQEKHSVGEQIPSIDALLVKGAGDNSGQADEWSCKGER